MISQNQQFVSNLNTFLNKTTADLMANNGEPSPPPALPLPLPNHQRDYVNTEVNGHGGLHCDPDVGDDPQNDSSATGGTGGISKSSSSSQNLNTHSNSGNEQQQQQHASHSPDDCATNSATTNSRLSHEQFRHALQMVVNPSDPRLRYANFFKIGEGSTGMVYAANDTQQQNAWVWRHL